MRFVLAAIALAGCAGQFSNSLESDDLVDADEPERPLGPVHGVEREHVEYEVRLRGLVVGRIQIAVGDRGVVDGRPAVIVKSRATGAGLADVLGQFSWELTSTVDIDSGCVVEEDDDMSIEMMGKNHHHHRVRKLDRATCHRNIHASAGALRGWRSRVGSQTNLDVSMDDFTFDVSLQDAARETIQTALGSTPAVRYDGMLRGKYPISGWLSDEDARVPLRMRSGSKLGQIEMEIVSYDVKD
jgi:hypothetical protein